VDELKDCEEKERDDKARQLILEFGDVKMLAILLRRAKKRCRPLWRTIVARTFQAAGVLMVCFIVYAVWFFTGKPTISVDYLALLNKINRPEVRNEDNAWPYYEKAIAIYTKPDQTIQEITERQREEFKKRLSFGGLEEEKQNEIQQWLKENKSYWDNLEISHKHLMERCFKEGLVPLADLSFTGEYSTQHYRVFDDEVKNIIERIEHPRLDHLPEYEMMMQMEMMYGYGPFFGIQREIELDPDIALDSEVISLFGSYSQEELEKIKKGIDIGVISWWISNPPAAAKSLFDYLLPFEKKLIVKWVEDNESAWKEFKAGSLKSYCYKEYQYRGKGQDKSLLSIDISQLQQMIELTRVGIWRSRIAVEQDHLQQSIDDCLAIARVGNHWQDKGTIIEQLSGLTIRNLAYDELLPVLATQKLSAGELNDLQYQLSQFYPKNYPQINIEGERIAFMDVVQRLFTKGGPGGGHLIPQKTEIIGDIYEEIAEIAEDAPVGRKFFENATLTSMCLLHARRDATVEFGRQIYDRQAEIIRMSPYQRHKCDLIDTDEMMMSMSRYRYAVLYYLIPAAEHISELSYQGRVLHEVLITISAIQRRRLEKGDFPENLVELIEADYLEELPIDPYSDKYLIYKKTEDDFLLYSFGPDCIDNGGKPGYDRKGEFKLWFDKEADAVFWPMPEPQQY